jgi:PAS domain S-box-containing protein
MLQHKRADEEIGCWLFHARRHLAGVFACLLGWIGGVVVDRRYTIGLLTTESFVRYAPGHWLGVADSARAHDANLICFLGEAPYSPPEFHVQSSEAFDLSRTLASLSGTRSQAAAVFDLVDARSIDGLIIWSSVLSWFSNPADMLRFCTRYHLPSISVEVSLEGLPSVLLDNYGGMRAVVSHLIEVHGHRRIAFQRGADNHLGMRERYRGYADALAEHGLPLDLNLVTPPTTWDGRKDVQVLLDERGLRPGVDFQALAGASDGMLRGVHELFVERGIRIPGDVAVVGFDNNFEVSIFTPPYTTVDPQFYDVGRRAAELLLARLTGQVVPEQVTVPAQLVLRQSCGCPDGVAWSAAASAPHPTGTNQAPAAARSLTEHICAYRDAILADLRAAVGDAGEDTARLLEAFCAAVDRAMASIFFDQLDQTLRRAQAAGGDVSTWHAALTVLRGQARELRREPELLARAEDLCQQGHVMIGETARRAEAYRAFQTKQQVLALREVEAALLSRFDIDELATVLERALPRLGIPAAYLALYEDPRPYSVPQAAPEWSRLLLVHPPPGQAQADRRFSSGLLAPPGVLPRDRRLSLFVEPLYFRERQLGFALFELGPPKLEVYEMLRHGLSNALYGGWLLEARTRAETTLRQHAMELEVQRRELLRRAMLERVVQAGKAIARDDDLQTCLLRVHRSIRHDLGFDRVGLWLYDAETQLMRGTYGTSRTGELTDEWEITIPAADDIGFRSVLDRPDSFFFIEDYSGAADVPLNPLMVGVKQHATVAAWAGERPVAVLTVDNLLTQRPIAEEQIEALRLIAGYVGLAIENARLLEQIRQADRNYRLVTDHASDAICLLDEAGHYSYISPSFQTLLGYDPAALIGTDAFALVHPDDQATVQENWEHLDRLAQVPLTFRYRHHNGSWRHFEARGAPFMQNGSRYVVLVGRDVTERRQLEEQLLKTQRMEAIGQLAGGIAHDFNNLLVVISSAAELAIESLAPDDPSQIDLHAIHKAAGRAANLTRQLLTFARRQVSDPQTLNLNDLILDVDKLLRRLLPEHIALVTAPAAHLWPVRADPSQLEQVLVNLAVNARDAMPDGGALTIETANITLDQEYPHGHIAQAHGPHVMLAVTDTGVGMSEEVQRHAFEPFFTTKAPGQGTGLGLATCYGIISQHGGSIQIYSEPGHGTSVKVYLPRAGADSPEAPSSKARAQLPRGTETVLLAEDEEAVRSLVARTLRAQGYTVLEATNGAEALAIVEQRAGAPIQLLLTDMIMPRVGGYELAQRVRQHLPSIRVLLMSGYTDNAAMQSGALDSQTAFLQKPFTPTALAHSVREALDS